MRTRATATSLSLRCDTVLVVYEEVVQALNDIPSPRAFRSSTYRDTTSRRYERERWLRYQCYGCL
jgi:hypothetical protein